MRDNTGTPRGTLAFKRRPVIGGGYNSGVSFSTDGVTIITSVDICAAHVRRTGDTRFQPLVTQAIMPSGDIGYNRPNNGVLTDSGCYAAAACPSNNAKVYFTENAFLYKAVYSGGAWTATRCNLAAKRMLSNSFDQRFWMDRLVVDPFNDAVAVLGTEGDGQYVTVDSGANFSSIGIPAGSLNSGFDTPHLIACNAAGASSGGIMQEWVISRYGTGIYRSTTGPNGSYSLIAGSPTAPNNMFFDASGNLWCVDLAASVGNKIKKWNRTSWSTVTHPGDIYTIAMKGTVLIGMEQSGALINSQDSGATWIANDRWNKNYPGPIGIYQNCPKAPWRDGNYAVSCSQIKFNPAVSNELWCTFGLGIQKSNPPTTFSRWDWYDETDGIENMIARQYLAVPGGAEYWAFWDQGVFTGNKLFPPTASQKLSPPNQAGVNACWHMDYAADDPNCIVALVDQTEPLSCYTESGPNAPMLLLPAHPNAPTAGGTMVMNRKRNVLWLATTSASAKLVYKKTTDAWSDPWRNVPFPGYPSGVAGWGNGYPFYTRREVADADKTVAGVFYVLADAAMPSGMPGMWKLTNECDTQTRMVVGPIDGSDAGASIIKCVPGYTGHVVYAPGVYGPTAPFYRTQNDFSGGTMGQVPNVTGVNVFGFGAPAPTKSYPTIVISGKVGGVFGLWMSLDFDQATPTWKSIGEFPMGQTNEIVSIDGKMTAFGEFEIGLNGGSFLYGNYSYQMRIN